MRINTNIMALNAQRNLSVTGQQLSSTLEKLASGQRINRAADDASGLARSEGLRSEIRGTDQAVRNAQDGISFVQTAEGALEEVQDSLQRIRELAVGAANSTSDGTAEQDEIAELVEEIDAIGDRTQFSGQEVFADYDGGDALVFQVGSSSGDTIEVTLDLRIDTSGTDGFIGENLDAIEVNDGANPDFDTILDNLDTAIGEVSETRSELGATQNRLEASVRNLQVASENLSASESRIRDADIAAETVDFTRDQILQQAGTSVLAQANALPQNVVGLLQ